MTMKVTVKNEGPEMYTANVTPSDGSPPVALKMGESCELYVWQGKTLLIEERPTQAAAEVPDE